MKCAHPDCDMEIWQALGTTMPTTCWAHGSGMLLERPVVKDFKFLMPWAARTQAKPKKAKAR